MVGSVKIRERALLFRSLEVLFSAGISLPRSLRILKEQAEDAQLKRALETIERRVQEGLAFSHAVKEFPYLFSDHCRRTLEVAESAGALPAVLNRLSAYEEKAYQTTLLFRQALIYPAWILLVCVIFVVWVPPFLFGELFEMLESSGVELPLLTRVVLAASKACASPFFYIFVAVVLLFFFRGVQSLAESPRTQYRFYKLLHANRFVGQQLTAIATCRFSRCLEMLAEAGVPMTQALKLAGNAAGDPILKRRMPVVIDDLMGGATLEDALAVAHFFPQPFLSTVKMGQESGKLSDVLSKIVLLYEAELEYRARSIMTALEPLAMLLMGLTVGVFIVATMSPLMELIKNF